MKDIQNQGYINILFIFRREENKLSVHYVDFYIIKKYTHSQSNNINIQLVSMQYWNKLCNEYDHMKQQILTWGQVRVKYKLPPTSEL